jgi:hypothetical protein
MLTSATARIRFSYKAEVAIGLLPAGERNRALSLIRTLPHNFDELGRFPNVERVVLDPRMYVMRASSKIRVVFRFDGSFLDVLDVVPRERLHLFLRGRL